MARLAGLLLILAGILIFGSLGVAVKALEERQVPLLQISFVRYVIVIALSASVIKWQQRSGAEMPLMGKPSERRALIVRAVLYFGALNFYYWAFYFIPLGMCTVLGYTFPLVTAIVAHFGWCGAKEHLSPVGWTCCVLGLLGTGVVCSPWSWTVSESKAEVVIGTLLTLGSALSWAVQIIVIRNTRTNAHWLQVEFVTGLVHAFVLTPVAWLCQFAYLLATRSDGESGSSIGETDQAGKSFLTTMFQPLLPGPIWLALCTIGLVAFVGLGCSTRGFQLEEAPRGAIIMYLEIPYMYGAQWLIFDEALTAPELGGVILVLVACLTMASEKVWRSSMGERAKFEYDASAACGLPRHLLDTDPSINANSLMIGSAARHN